MRIFHFCSWWWSRNDWYARICACFFIFWTIPCLVATIFFGHFALNAILYGMLVTIVGSIICITCNLIYSSLRATWNEFADEQPTEDIAILRKLKGISTPSR